MTDTTTFPKDIKKEQYNNQPDVRVEGCADQTGSVLGPVRGQVQHPACRRLNGLDLGLNFGLDLDLNFSLDFGCRRLNGLDVGLDLDLDFGLDSSLAFGCRRLNGLDSGLN